MLTRPAGRPANIGAPIKTYVFPDTARLSFTNADFLQGFELSFEQTMASLQYLGPLREDPSVSTRGPEASRSGSAIEVNWSSTRFSRRGSAGSA